jgi:pimeloyl-ACP methyl ester carboxylesterase
MLERGWLVTATDYVGLGTPGPELYLVAEAEARDVVNSVRAAAQLPDADIGSRYAVWGHSQGGHSALWTGHLSAELAPEFSLVAVAAAAPAAQLADIMGAQWKGAIGWGIGPEVAVSWPLVDPQLSLDDILTGAGLRNYERLANECLNNDDALLIELAARQALGQSFFTSDPVNNADWKNFADAQTPPPLPADMPTLIAQSTADQVVLAWPNAVTQQKWCSAGSDLTMLWLGVVNHQQTANTAGPSVVSWLEERFAGKPTQPNCAIPPPVDRP